MLEENLDIYEIYNSCSVCFDSEDALDTEQTEFVFGNIKSDILVVLPSSEFHDFFESSTDDREMNDKVAFTFEIRCQFNDFSECETKAARERCSFYTRLLSHSFSKFISTSFSASLLGVKEAPGDYEQLKIYKSSSGAIVIICDDPDDLEEAYEKLINEKSIVCDKIARLGILE